MEINLAMDPSQEDETHGKRAPEHDTSVGLSQTQSPFVEDMESLFRVTEAWLTSTEGLASSTITTAWFARLVRLYGEPTRHYHTLAHVHK